VASAKRGVLGGLASEDDVDEEEVEDVDPADMVRAGVRFKAVGRFLSSWIAIVAGRIARDNKERKKKPVFDVGTSYARGGYGTW